MNRLLTILILCAFALGINAQTIYLCKGQGYTEVNITEGLEINPNEVDSIVFTKPQFPAPVVTVSYNGSSATIDIPGFAPYITATISGADVTITNTQVDGTEPTYIVRGSSTNGSLTINGSYKFTLQLDGLNLTSATGAPLDIQCGKRCALVLTEGTTNTLVDAASSQAKAALYCKGHLEVQGAGTLYVSGNANHAISTKEYMELKSTTGTINIVSAKNDAIHVGQYLNMKGGTINIDSNTKGDAIQVEVTNDATDEYNGQVFIKGGTINATVTSEDTKALKVDGDITITGGTLNLNANGNGTRGIQTDSNLTISEDDNVTTIFVNAAGGKCTLAECADDPHKCTGIKAEGNIVVNAGTVTVYNTGKKSKGIKCDGTYTHNGGTVNASID